MAHKRRRAKSRKDEFSPGVPFSTTIFESDVSAPLATLEVTLTRSGQAVFFFTTLLLAVVVCPTRLTVSLVLHTDSTR